jgi:hypothetical protein
MHSGLVLATRSKRSLGRFRDQRCPLRCVFGLFCGTELPLQVGYPFLLLQHLAS